MIGCNKDDVAVKSYQAPKEPAPSALMPAQADSAGPSAAPADSTPPITWTIPQGWKELPGDSQFRYATFSVSADDPKAELTVVPLGAEAAAVSPNLSRWAGQLKLPTPTEAELSKFCQQTQVSGEQATFVDMTGSAETGNPPARMLAAIVPHDGRTWFFTLKAPEPVAAAQKSNFETFLHSVQFPTSAAPSADAAPNVPGPGLGSAAPSGQTYKLVKWKTPEGWVEQPGANAMRVTSFRVGTGTETAEVIVSRINEAGFGSMDANINRWRGQVGLEPSEDTKQGVSATLVGGKPGMKINFVGPKTGDQQPKEIVVALTILGGDGWFFKMLGPQSVVSAQKDNFQQFLDSLQFQPESN
jgi:hypothetical protein